jgi:hypothetical protein
MLSSDAIDMIMGVETKLTSSPILSISMFVYLSHCKRC